MTAEQKQARASGAKGGARKKVKKHVTDAIAHVHASFNNTHRHDHRSSGQHPVVGDQRWLRFPRLCARARRSPRRLPPRRPGTAAQEHGVKMVEVRVKGPGPGRESAVRALNACGLKITNIFGRHADPAQRLPSAQKRRV